MLTIASVAALPALGQNAPAASCDGLANMSLPGATITATQSYAAGEYKLPVRARAGAGAGNGAGAGQAAGAPGGPGGGPGGPGGGGGGAQQQPVGDIPAFCRVSITLAPSSDSDIKMEVWLPASGWNGKFVGVANMNTGGSILYQNMVTPLLEGYAAAANDTGHTGNTADFAVGHPEKMIDYAYRADHDMTVKAKAIVQQFYGKPASQSIWIGCSLGGLEALIEAKRYPDDYDAIIAGAPPNPVTRFNAEQIWGAWLNLNHPEGSIPPEKFTMIHAAALKACGTPVGLAQGFIEDPEHCHFDPATLLCKSGDAADCLTAPQVARLKQLYLGPVDPRNGKVIFPGPNVGAEAEFVNSGRQPLGPAVELYKSMVYQNPNWDWKTFDYATSVDKAAKDIDPLLRVDADLSGFINRGGKLMLYIGWTEGHNGNDVIAYYKEVLKDAQPSKRDNVRLFLVPGMNHCGGGAGCDTFEKIGVADQWLQTGKAPDEILASKVVGGKTIRTRPLCAYPKVAQYNGTGSMDEAASFTCKGVK